MFRSYRLLMVSAAFAFSGAAASAQDDNTLFITQDSGLAGSPAGGNTLFVDQSEATGSRVNGSLDDVATGATQFGQGNDADIRIEGVGGAVALNQLSSQSQLAGNSAEIDLIGLNAQADLFQDGFGNSGTLFVNGRNAFGRLRQNGDNNVGSVRVDGPGAAGRLIQNGNNNDTGIEVSGAGTDVTVTQNGDNLSRAPVVRSNGGTVIITQTRN